MNKPVVLFDGDCTFCKRWVARWRALSGDRIEFEALQIAGARFPQIPREQLEHAIHLIEPDGRVTSGAHAVFRALALAGRKRWLASAYHNLPGFAASAESFYRFVARHRGGANTLDQWLIGRSAEPVTYRVTRDIFVRALGAIYLIAFLSLAVQIDGLIGSRGILPLREVIDYLRHSDIAGKYWLFPTLSWFDSSDRFLRVLCIGGAVLSCLLIIGIAPIPLLIALFVSYLSLVVDGQDFLSFQWDALLLETGFIAIFVAPLQPMLRAARGPPPSRAAIFLLKWLLFRLMFESGIVKLSSGDPTWRSWAALKHHYETQPLPPWTAYYLHHAPAWFGNVSMAVMFVAELVLPFLIFGPRRMRGIAFRGIVIFQILIALTGNFGFFNWLTIVLCVVLLDDSSWPLWMKRDLPRLRALAAIPEPRWRWRRALILPIAAILFSVTFVQLVESFHYFDVRWPGTIISLQRQLSPLRIANPYGLFQVMTTSRPEIIIEGSDDGVSWRAYEFKYKPGNVNRRPIFVQPHMPRLDWQMWFAALGDLSHNQWFIRFAQRLLEGEPAVLGLMSENPFPDHPPRLLRARLYDYHFTDYHEPGGPWWRRELIGEYLATARLSNQP